MKDYHAPRSLILRTKRLPTVARFSTCRIFHGQADSCGTMMSLRKTVSIILSSGVKDKNDVFHLGVAVADRPEGPFKPQADHIRGSYSIDPCVFKDDDGSIYVYFGGLWGGQLQRYKDKAMGKVRHSCPKEMSLHCRQEWLR